MLKLNRLLALLLLAGALEAPHLAHADDASTTRDPALESALVRLAADRIDAVLGAVADSTSALGHAYARLAVAQGDAIPTDPDRWLADSDTQGNTTGVRTWPADLTRPPAFQAPYPAFYSYRGDKPGEAVLRQFDLFGQLAPTFRAAYESFPFSWVYVTTAQDAMMIYPYVPIDEAVSNGTPTEAVYYQAADLPARQVGWTAPYLDLVGAGMMVTASYPVYQDDTLLGVASRDITLDQLTRSMLAHLTIDGGSALIVDADGLAIDPTLAAEIDSTNTSAGAAVLYFRTDAGRQALAVPDAEISQSAPTNAVVEQVLTAAAPGDSDVVRLEIDGKRVLAGIIERAGWMVVLILPPAT